MYRAQQIADYVVRKCINDDHPISNLQLQKIMYFIQVEFLKTYRCVAFNDAIQAWKFGPVVPLVYYDYYMFGGFPILFVDEPASEISWNEKKHKEIVDAVMTKRRMDNVWDMVKETHKMGSPWSRVFKDGLGFKAEIPVQLLKEYVSTSNEVEDA